MGTSHSQRENLPKSKSLPHQLRSSMMSKPISKTVSTMQSRKTLNSFNQLNNSHKQGSSQLNNQKKVSNDGISKVQKRVSFLDVDDHHDRSKSQNNIQVRNYKYQNAKMFPRKQIKPQYFVESSKPQKTQRYTQKHKKEKLVQPSQNQYSLNLHSCSKPVQKQLRVFNKKISQYKITNQTQLNRIYPNPNPENDIKDIQQTRKFRNYQNLESTSGIFSMNSKTVPIRHNYNQFGTVYR